MQVAAANEPEEQTHFRCLARGGVGAEKGLVGGRRLGIAPRLGQVVGHLDLLCGGQDVPWVQGHELLVGGQRRLGIVPG